MLGVILIFAGFLVATKAAEEPTPPKPRNLAPTTDSGT
jgi:hypothetical protein